MPRPQPPWKVFPNFWGGAGRKPVSCWRRLVLVSYVLCMDGRLDNLRPQRKSKYVGERVPSLPNMVVRDMVERGQKRN